MFYKYAAPYGAGFADERPANPGAANFQGDGERSSFSMG